MRNKTTIFLSHSSKDLEKVRNIRNVFEVLNCDALIFYLKCLDDGNPNLEQFIKDEIEARNIFVYCKSANAEASPWVQKELEYIKSLSGKLLYILDIEKDFAVQLISLLSSILEIIKNTRVFFSYPHNIAKTIQSITDYLEKKDFSCFSDKELLLGESLAEQIEKQIEKTAKEGIFVAVLCGGKISQWQDMEILYAYNHNAKILILHVGDEIEKLPEEFCYSNPITGFISPRQFGGIIKISEIPTTDELRRIADALFRLSNKSC